MTVHYHARWRIPGGYLWTNGSWPNTPLGEQYRDEEARDRVREGYEVQVGEGPRPSWRPVEGIKR